jgi:hypothetical protein
MPNLPADARASRLAALCRLYLRDPNGFATDAATGDPVIIFSPPLSLAEQTTFDRIVNLSKSLVEGITVAEWQAIEPDIAGLATYQGLANPTLAQTVLAVKAQSRILRALIRN